MSEMDVGSTAVSSACAHCQRPAKSRCTGCLGAPVYEEGVSKTTFYCSQVCQTAHWHQHKPECRKLQTRKSLGRAALLLQAIIYRIRLQASPIQFKSARIDDAIIFLEGYQSGVFNTQRQLKPFPVCFDDNRSLFEAVLVYLGGLEAMVYLHGFAKELFAGLCSNVEEVNFSVINQRLQIFQVLPNGHQIDPPDTVFDLIYRVTLRNGEMWAVDTAGSQYGYPDPLCPWSDFEQRRSGKVIAAYRFGYIRHQFYQSSGMFSTTRAFPVRHMVAKEIEKQELANALEEKIPAWAQERGGKLDAILTGSDAAFKQAKDRFLDQLENHIVASMTQMYTPEQIARRTNDAESQISQNVPDADKQRGLESLLRCMASAVGIAPGP